MTVGFDKSERHDKASIEADPRVVDDIESADSTVAPSATFPHIIPTPLPGGVDHVANGVGTRNAGFGTIRLRGAPLGAVPVRAFLYWGTMKPAATATETVSFNGRRVTGTLLGFPQQPTCWGAGVFAAYRASVLSLIPPSINGDYQVACMQSFLTDGRDSWAGPFTLPLSEGATLVVLYAHISVPVTARTFINEGPAFFFSAISINNPLPGGLPNYNSLKHTRLGADGQVGGSTTSINPVTDERTFLGPPLNQIKGRFSPFNWDSDWNGDDGTPLNQLWDTHTDSFGRILAVGIGAYVVRYLASGDCVFPVAHVLSVR